MNRRDFVKEASRTAFALPFLRLPGFIKAMQMGIVVHSYAMRWRGRTQNAMYPPFADAIDLLEHCHEIGAGGIQVQIHDWGSDFTKKMRGRREQLGMFLEGSVALPTAIGDINRFERDIGAASEAGASLVRTVCLNGRRYEDLHGMSAFERFVKNSIASLEMAEPILRKHRIRLAIENHKDWRASELISVLNKLSSEWVGVNLDFGNNIALIEDPMEVVHALAPYTFTTHVKDMGVREYEDGFLLSEVPLGQGILDLRAMFDICRQHKTDIHFNLEMITRDPLKIPCFQDAFWETFPSSSALELARILRMVRGNPFPSDLPVVSTLSEGKRLATEEQNIITSLSYSRTGLGMN